MGVEVLPPGTDGALDWSLIDKLTLATSPIPAGHSDPSSPTRDGWIFNQLMSSPATPLDLPSSPNQSPLKKKKGAKVMLEMKMGIFAGIDAFSF